MTMISGMTGDSHGKAGVAVSAQTASYLAVRAAVSVAERVNSRQAQVRRSFVVSTNPGEIPPLAMLLRGGRGGGVRLRLYISLLWFAANPPYDVTYPARAWATLLDLPDPGGSGARRISDALSWLDAHKFVQVQVNPGQPSRVVLLNESGDGSPYEVPGATLRRMPADTGRPSQARLAHRYFQIPPTFWTAGWLASLSGPGVAMALVLLAESIESKESGIWFSPKVATERFGLSAETRSKGLKELNERGMIVIRKIRANALDPFESHRTRNLYVFQSTAFANGPAVTSDPDELSAKAQN